MEQGSEQPHAMTKLPRCPSCLSADNVQPFSVGLVGNYPTTVEYKCCWCQRIFPSPKPETGYLAHKVMS